MGMTQLPQANEYLPGRVEAMPLSNKHYVNGTPIKPPFKEGLRQLVVGMGCFWGAERRFWQMRGVVTTAVGYAGGQTPNPNYREVCSGYTGHTEVVLVVYDPFEVSLEDLLKCFWESHDPTQGMRQGNDQGTQYRSAVFTHDEADLKRVEASKTHYQSLLACAGRGEITSEIGMLKHFYYAERDHQQYLAKVPNGYCGLKGTGIDY